MAGNKLITALVTNIINPVILVLFAVALLIFIWGVFQYVRGASDPKARETGAQHILYGVIGLFIMLSAFAIVRVVLNSFSLDTKYVDQVSR